MSTLLHIAEREVWAAAVKAGQYRPESLAEEGFIHCSLPEQVVPVADATYRGRQGLVLLVIDPAQVTAEIRFEDCYQGGQEFPHKYGPLPVEAVVQVLDIDPGSAGIPISVQDATVGGMQNVLAGDQAMSVYKSIKAETAAAAAAIALLKGEDLTAMTGGLTLNNGTNDIPFVALTPIDVTGDNVAETVIANGFRTREEICAGDFEQCCPADR